MWLFNCGCVAVYIQCAIQSSNSLYINLILLDNEGHYGEETVHLKAEKVLEDSISNQLKSIATSTIEQHSTTVSIPSLVQVFLCGECVHNYAAN